MMALVAHIQENPMKALILRADPDASCDTARALIDKGFQILTVDTQAVAHALIRVDAIDLLVMDERIEGQLTHAIALSGERKNPNLSAILLTDRGRDETDDLFDLIPSLYGMIGSDAASELVAQLAVAAVEKQSTASVMSAQEDTTEEAETNEVAPLVLALSDMTPTEDDSESGAPCYADIAIAAPALAEIMAAENQIRLEKTVHPDPVAQSETCVVRDVARQIAVVEKTALDRKALLEKVEDVVNEEVASLFRKYPSSAYVPLHTHVRANAG